ncbi:hypothetical protein GC176_04100 [bacterium]|nr:hypothetical protein [bacterium]
MALDVHIVVDPKCALPHGWPAFQFDEAAHASAFYYSGINIYSRYSMLRRMLDFYAEVVYPYHDLESLIAEIDDLLPHLGHTAGATALKEFRNVCLEAFRTGRSILLYPD